MKAQDGVVEHLNAILSAELLAINQSFVHAKLCTHWGFARLHGALRARSLEAMKAADRLIGHVLYLEAVPQIRRSPSLRLGQTVPEQFTIELTRERELLALLRDGVRHCATVGDYTTRHLLEDMAVRVDAQIEWIETQQTTIDQVGLAPYLAEQITPDEGSSTVHSPP